jgi:hypothetical protein
MGQVKNTSFRAEYNETITAAKTNAKFTDVQTESTDIDDSNIKAQGVDRINLQGKVVKVFKSFNNVGGAYPDSVYAFNTKLGRGPLEVSQHQLLHGTGVYEYEFDFSSAPVTLAQGDLIRINYSLLWWRVENQQFDKATGNAGTAPTANERDYRLCWLVAPCYLSAPYDPLSSFWNNFPNKVNWMTYYEQGGPNGDTSPPDRYQIPTGDNPVSGFDDGILVFSPDGYFSDPETKHEQTHHGVWTYQNTSGSDITLYKIGFFIQGPLKLISQIGSRNRGFETVDTTGLGTGNSVQIGLGNFQANCIIYENGST